MSVVTYRLADQFTSIDGNFYLYRVKERQDDPNGFNRFCRVARDAVDSDFQLNSFIRFDSSYCEDIPSGESVSGRAFSAIGQFYYLIIPDNLFPQNQP